MAADQDSYRPSGEVQIIRAHEPSWDAMCFHSGIDMTLPINDAPGTALKVSSHYFHSYLTGSRF